jgi:hypothetical protein
MEVRFEEEKFQRPVPMTNRGIVGWLVRKGIVKDTNQANMLLLGVVLSSMVIVLLITFLSSTNTQPEPDPTDSVFQDQI